MKYSKLKEIAVEAGYDILDDPDRWGGRVKKHLVIKYFDTYPEHKFYFDSKEEAEKFIEEKMKNDTKYLTTYEYRGEVILNLYQQTK